MAKLFALLGAVGVVAIGVGVFFWRKGSKSWDSMWDQARDAAADGGKKASEVANEVADWVVESS